MELENVLDEKIMTVSLKAADKDDALKQMARQLKENGYIADVEAFVADIYKREKEGITGSPMAKATVCPGSALPSPTLNTRSNGKRWMANRSKRSSCFASATIRILPAIT